MPATLLRSCPLCGQENADTPDLADSQPPWQLKQCSACGMVYLQNALSYQALEEDFAWERTFSAETHTRRSKHPLLRTLGRLPKHVMQQLTRRDKLLQLARRYFAPGPVLDVGCAGGHTLAHFPAHYIPYGIEISHELSQIAASRFVPRGGRVIQSDALNAMAQLQPGTFTGIIMTSFLEHELNPAQVLHAAAPLLQAGGSLILKVPNYASWNRHIRGTSWSGYRFPDHVNYFTPNHLLRLLTGEKQYTVRQFGLRDHPPTSDSMWLVAQATH